MTRSISWQTAVVLVAFIAAAVIVWWLSPEHRGDILAALAVAGPAVLAAMRPLLAAAAGPPSDGPPTRPSRRPTIPPTLPILALALLMPACGASALRTHATVYTIAASSYAATAPSIAPACEALLADCHEEPSCVDEAARRCRAAASAAELARTAVQAYGDAVRAAAMADEGLVLPALLEVARGLVRAYEGARVALEPLHVTLPALPAFVGAFLGAS